MMPDRRRVDTLRALPLETVATALGYRRCDRDRCRWRRRGSIVSINGTRFYDHVACRGGGGAIDLVIHAGNCGFLTALGRLETLEGGIPAETGTWPRVRHWLTDVRGLSSQLVDDCHGRGLVTADPRANVVFVCRDATGRRTGAELRGTREGQPWRGMERGTSKRCGGFWIDRGRERGVLALVESAIDALSALSVVEMRRAGTIISTAGVSPQLPPWIAAFGTGEILCGYDADAAGDHAADRLGATNRRVVRVRPEGGKDWNDVMRMRKRGGSD